MTMTDRSEQLDLGDAFSKLRELAEADESEATEPKAESKPTGTPDFRASRPTVVPSKPQRGPRPNRYPGECVECGHDVPAEAGRLAGRDDGGRWTVAHLDGECPEGDPPADRFDPTIIIDPGIYTVEHDDGTHRTFRIEVLGPDSDFAPGETIIGYLRGADNTNDYDHFAFINPGNRLAVWRRYREGYEAIVGDARALVADPDAHLTAVNCIRCNATLSRPDSVGRNLGPDCAKAWGFA